MYLLCIVACLCQWAEGNIKVLVPSYFTEKESRTHGHTSRKSHGVKLEFGITLILKRKELPGINPHLPHSSPPIDPLVLVALFRSIPVLVPALLVVHYVSTLRY